MAATETEKPIVVALTGKQRLALSLAKGGMSHAEIADRMGLRHRQTATQLIKRARHAEQAFRKAVADFIGGD